MDLLSGFGDLGIPPQQVQLGDGSGGAFARCKGIAVLTLELVELAPWDAEIELRHGLGKARCARRLIEHLVQTEEVSCIDDGIALIALSDDFKCCA